MKIAFAGSPKSAVQVLDALQGKHEIVSVLTKEDAPVGRKRIITQSDVAVAAQRLGLPLLKRNNPTPDDLEWLRSTGAEICVVVAYGALLSPEVLAGGIKFINVHFSLLPKYRGAAPVQAAILHGDTNTGITVFEIDQGMDTGPVLSQATIKLDGDETTELLLQKLTAIAIPQVHEVLENYPESRPQLGMPSYAPKLSRSDGQINSSDSIEIAFRKIRALILEPGVWLETSLGVLAVIDASLVDSPIDLEEISTHNLRLQESNGHVFLRNNEGLALEVHKLQPAGKQAMASIDWWRGVREAPIVV